MASQPSMIPRLSSTRSSTSSIGAPDPAELGKSLLDAAEDGDRQRIQNLLQEGADVNFFDDHYTALHHAAAGGHIELIGYLVDRGANEHALTDQGATALHVAASEGQVMMIRDLIWRGIKVNTLQSDHSTPLHLAVQAGHKDAALELLKRGADPNLADKSWKRTPLHIAATDGEAGIAETLLKFRAKPNVQDSTGASPLYEAVNNNDISVAEVLLVHGADVHLKDEMTRRSPLQDAKTDEMKALLAKYEDREPVYEIPEPPLEEVNPFKASMEKLKGEESTSSLEDVSASPQMTRTTLPRDIKMNMIITSSPKPSRIPSPTGAKRSKGSPFSKIKFGSKDKLNTSKSKTLTPQGSPAPGKKSPRLSHIPIDYKQKITTKVDLGKAGSDPLSQMTKARSVEALDQGSAPESKIPRLGKDGVELRGGSKSPWGGRLDLSNRRSTSQYSTLPKDMKYTDMKDRLMVTKTGRGGALKTAPIVPFLPTDVEAKATDDEKSEAIAAVDGTVTNTKDSSDNESDTSSKVSSNVSSVDVASPASVEDVAVEENPVDTHVKNHEEETKVETNLEPEGDVSWPPPPTDKELQIMQEANDPQDKTANDEDLTGELGTVKKDDDKENGINNNAYQSKGVDENKDNGNAGQDSLTTFNIWQEDSTGVEESPKTSKKKKSGNRRLLCCCFGV